MGTVGAHRVGRRLSWLQIRRCLVIILAHDATTICSMGLYARESRRAKTSFAHRDFTWNGGPGMLVTPNLAELGRHDSERPVLAGNGLTWPRVIGCPCRGALEAGVAEV